MGQPNWSMSTCGGMIDRCNIGVIGMLHNYGGECMALQKYYIDNRHGVPRKCLVMKGC